MSRGRAGRAALVAAFALTAVLLVGCGSGSDGRATDPGQGGGAQGGPACTEIGCDSGVIADLSGLRKAIPEASQVEICLGSSCETFSRSQFSFSSVVSRRLKGEGMRRVSMVVFDDSGKVISSSGVSAPSVRNQPNGPDCPPVCFQVTVRVDPEGRLVR